MKWILTRPSSRVHVWVTLGCVLFMVVWPVVQGLAFPVYHSTLITRTLPLLIADFARTPPSVMNSSGYIDVKYVVVERKGTIVILTSRDEGFRDFEADPESISMWYFAGTYQTGLWGPTREVDAQMLINSNQIWGTNTTSWMRSPTPRVLKAQAALVAMKGLDPRLATTQVIEDKHTVYLGFVINGLYVLALLGLAWSLMWCLSWAPLRMIEAKRRSRMSAGLCPMCAYNLEGTPDRCPECGWGQDDEARDA